MTCIAFYIYIMQNDLLKKRDEMQWNLKNAVEMEKNIEKNKDLLKKNTRKPAKNKNLITNVNNVNKDAEFKIAVIVRNFVVVRYFVNFDLKVAIVPMAIVSNKIANVSKAKGNVIRMYACIVMPKIISIYWKSLGFIICPFARIPC